MITDWKPVCGYEGIYEIRPGADGGRVRRVVPLARTRIGKLLGTPDPMGTCGPSCPSQDASHNIFDCMS